VATVAKLDITIETRDGKAEAGVFAPPKPAASRQAGIIYYMDAFGPRPATDQMAERLAAAGYVVLVPDLFYRGAPYGPWDAKTAFGDEATRTEIMSFINGTTQDMVVSDSASFLDALAKHGVTGRVGTVGYCMGGSRSLNGAAAYPDRIAAAASFHGGNLASDAPDSPHRRVGSISGRVYIGVAGVDRSFPPEQSAKLAQALREAEVDHIIENYVGKQHGWTVPDHGVFDAAGAERHWKRLLEFFAEAL